MRGRFFDQGGMFSYIQPERRIPANHPLREVRELVREVLKDLSHTFEKLYSHEGRPSIAPEQLFSALLLQVFYSIRSERQVMEQLEYNLLFRWFVGLSPDDPIWDATVFTKNRERLQEGDVFQKFMAKLLEHEKVKPLLSDEHFSVDGTLIEAWASHKSFKPKRSRDGDDGSNFHGQVRKNDTHQSTTDPEAKLYRKADGREAKLCYMGHALMENRNGLAVSGMVTQANGTAERRASEAMLKKKAKALKAHHRRRRQGLRHQRPCCGATPDERHPTRCAERQSHQDRQAAHERDRCADNPPHRLPDIADLSKDDRMHLRLGQATRHNAQNQTSRYCSRRRRLHAQSDRLQPDPHSQTAGRLAQQASKPQKTPAKTKRVAPIYLQK